MNDDMVLLQKFTIMVALGWTVNEMWIRSGIVSYLAMKHPECNLKLLGISDKI